MKKIKLELTEFEAWIIMGALRDFIGDVSDLELEFYRTLRGRNKARVLVERLTEAGMRE